MGKLSIRVREGEDPMMVTDTGQLLRVLEQAASDASSVTRPNMIDLTARNGDTLSIVVGGEETVLGFTHGNGLPPYYASRGASSEVHPVMTCYLHSAHHTEFPRHAVIARESGLAAAVEFLHVEALPKCVQWQEV